MEENCTDRSNLFDFTVCQRSVEMYSIITNIIYDTVANS
jgi:hypothetical protein